MTSFKWESRLVKGGFKKIAGVDEVGRGALAGPIVAAAVIFEINKIKNNYKFQEIKDSKVLSPSKREKLFKLITERCLCWSIASVSEKNIDKFGIGYANYLVFEKVIKKLKIKPDFILLDGQIKLKKSRVLQEAVIGGDQKVFSISAASILAKVWRDRLMCRLSKKHPIYKFDKHKGYGTVFHYATLKKYGPTPCHRLSFRLR